MSCRGGRNGWLPALAGMLGCVFLQSGPNASAQSPSIDDLKRLSVEQLMDVEVYCASRRLEPTLTSPKAMAWRLTQETWWASAARAVRVPSRVEADLTLFGVLRPGDSFESEHVNAYLLGMKRLLNPALSLDLATL